MFARTDIDSKNSVGSAHAMQQPPRQPVDARKDAPTARRGSTTAENMRMMRCRLFFFLFYAEKFADDSFAAPFELKRMPPPRRE